MPPPPNSLASQLAIARRRAGLSQGALGAKVGLAQSHVSKIERGAVDLQISTLIDIARALNLELLLVPRQLVPAVQALTRQVVGEIDLVAAPAYRLGEPDA